MTMRRVLAVSPNLASFVTPYSSGDVMGAINTIPLVSLSVGGQIKLKSLVVLDAANQKSALDIVFFDESPASSFGADNAAYSLADSDLSKCLGRISVAGADYVSSGSTNAEATERNLELILQCKHGLENIYFVVVSRGTPTYGAATDLSIKFGVEQD